jgi:hypothetical protein
MQNTPRGQRDSPTSSEKVTESPSDAIVVRPPARTLNGVPSDGAGSVGVVQWSADEVPSAVGSLCAHPATPIASSSAMSGFAMAGTSVVKVA